MHLELLTSLVGLTTLTTATLITPTNPNAELTRATNHGYCGWGYTLPSSQGQHVILLGDEEHHTEFAGNEGKPNSVFISLTCTCQLYGDERCNPNTGYYAEKTYGAYDLPSAVSCFRCVDARPPPV